MAIAIDSLSDLVKKYSNLVENNQEEADMVRVAETLALELDFLQRCLLEFFELGLVSQEQNLRFIELFKDLILLLETDPDVSRNVLSKRHYLYYFKRNLK